jgi:hypothetical protein
MASIRTRGTYRAPNVDHYRVIDETVGGARLKNVLEDPSTGIRYIAKLGGRNNDLEVMTEYAISVVGRSLGVIVADARIARYRGRLRFLSRYFLNIARVEELVHGIQLFRELYDEHTVGAVQQKVDLEQALFNVQAVRATFGAHYIQYGLAVEETLFTGFIRMLTHDALIGVQDRHPENWGVVVERGRASVSPRFAPLYDSARGLFCDFREDQLDRFFGADGRRKFDAYVCRSRPLIGFAGLAPMGSRKHLTHDQLLVAVYRQYPEQRAMIRTVIGLLNPEVLNTRLKGRLSLLCSGRRRALMVQCLTYRKEMLSRAIDEAVR